MPTLEWIGKDKVVNHHLEVPYRVLEEQYTYNAETSENMIIRGDNLEGLKALLPRYEGKVKCIYIDPPYNTGNEGWVYNDNVNDPRIKKWLGEVVGKEGEDLSRHDKWLCMMYPRLKLLQRLLAEDGAIFISIDDVEQSNLRLICDEILGASNYRAMISWRRKYSVGNNFKGIATICEYILVYSKSEKFQNHLLPRSDESKSRYSNPDNDPRGPWIYNIKHDVDCSIAEVNRAISNFFDGNMSDAIKSVYHLVEIASSHSPSYVLTSLKDFYGDCGEEWDEWYRVRSSDLFSLEKEKMSHIPFSKRAIIKNQRYSISGIPCLYLGHSIYGCWEEMHRPSLDSMCVSKFNLRNFNEIT